MTETSNHNDGDTITLQPIANGTMILKLLAVIIMQNRCVGSEAQWRLCREFGTKPMKSMGRMRALCYVFIDGHQRKEIGLRTLCCMIVTYRAFYG